MQYSITIYTAVEEAHLQIWSPTVGKLEFVCMEPQWAMPISHPSSPFLSPSFAILLWWNLNNHKGHSARCRSAAPGWAFGQQPQRPRHPARRTHGPPIGRRRVGHWRTRDAARITGSRLSLYCMPARRATTRLA